MTHATAPQYAAPAATPAKRGGLLRRLAPLAILPPVGAAIAYILAFNPTDRIADPTGPCVWHALTGINGPGCGGTRMVWYLLHGDLVEAARHHLVAFIALPFLGYAYIAWLANWTFGIQLPQFRPSAKLIAGYIVAFLLYSTVLRNLPWAPFSWFNIENLT